MAELADSGPKWIVRRGVKAALAGALCATGARWVVREVARRIAGGARVIVLSWHRPTTDFAADAQEALPSLLVSGATLRQQIQQLAREHEIVSMDEGCRRLAAPAAPAPSRESVPDVAVLTFDDAYAGVHHVALPVLRDLRVPAIVYVPTGLVGTRHRLLHDRIYASLCELRRRNIQPQAAGLAPAVQPLLDACGGDAPATTLDRLIARLPHGGLVQVAEALEKRLGMREEDLPEGTRLMSWEELRALQAAGVDVGGHTVNHAVLPNLPRALAAAEIRGCREDIEARLGATPRHFAYPNGFYSAGLCRAVAEAGFASAVTTEDTENRRGGNPFTLKRKTMWENCTLGAVAYSPALAACNLDGVFGALGWQRPTPGERPDAAEDAAESEPERAAG